VRFDTTTATASKMPLHGGEWFSFPYSRDGLGLICATRQTASVRVNAFQVTP
jgi:hypothetical protein